LCRLRGETSLVSGPAATARQKANRRAAELVNKSAKHPGGWGNFESRDYSLVIAGAIVSEHLFTTAVKVFIDKLLISQEKGGMLNIQNEFHLFLPPLNTPLSFETYPIRTETSRRQSDICRFWL
ncbi:MAG: hypothetical protein Q8K46_01580, partial [Deltaproteobacteria bacterium]|nr:hypothetical protein [Deltaproteobacteria bacterium]